MLKKIKSFLAHPLTAHMDMDSPETTIRRSRIIQEKFLLKKIYEGWYHQIRLEIPEKIPGILFEIGSGGGFLKQIVPKVFTSEILRVPGIDMAADACALPLKDNSVRCILMVDVFHHIPDVALFLEEASRCMNPGGKIIMIEPWNTPWSSFIYTHLHHEPFAPDAANWDFQSGNPLSGANMALPWIVFERDREKFRKTFSEWHIAKIVPHTPISYLISGGVSLREVVPKPLCRIVLMSENGLRPLIHNMAMFATIVLTKRTNSHEGLS